MRIDKYLKNSRLIKRRSIAKEACDQGKVTINEKTVKAGSEVSVGDTIELTLGTRIVKVEVTDILEHATKNIAKEMYKML